jgi:hypothetical protein
MARTTADEVKAVLLGDYDTGNSPDLTPYIDAANLIVGRVITCAGLKGVTYSTAQLTTLETWLAAWAYCQSDKTYLEKKTADAGAKYQATVGKGFESNNYGQTALMLDYSGCLAAMSNKARASVTWMGKTPLEKIPFYDR